MQEVRKPGSHRGHGVAFHLLACVLLAFLAFFAHFPLLRTQVWHLHGDIGWLLLETDKLRNGDWTAFYFGQNYGGTTFGYLRAAWCALWDGLAGPRYESWLGHMVFSFSILPVFMALAAYGLVSRYCSRFGAVVAGVLAAGGFNFWVLASLGDYYIGHFLLCCLLLGWRAGYRNPFIEMEFWQLFAVSVLAGLATYTFQASAIYAGAFFFPIEWIYSKIVEVQRKPRLIWVEGKFEWFCFSAAFFFVLLYFYLTVIGPDLGVIASKRIKLHAGPNLDYTAFFLGVLLLKRFFSAQGRGLFIELLQTSRAALRSARIYRWIRRLSLVFAGFTLGLLPQWWPTRDPETQVWMFANSHVVDHGRMVELAFQLPRALGELVTPKWDSSLRHLPLFLALAALAALFARAKSSPRLQSVAFTGLLCAAAFCFVATYTDAGPARYLLPVFPILMVSYGVITDGVVSFLRKMRSKGWGPVPAVSGAIGFASLISGQYYLESHARAAYAAELDRTSPHEQVIQTIADFRKADVGFVYSDDYFRSNLYSLISNQKPPFAPPPRALTTKRIWKLALESKDAGFLLTHGLIAEKSGAAPVYAWYGHNWTLRFLETIGDCDLFVGSRE